MSLHKSYLILLVFLFCWNDILTADEPILNSKFIDKNIVIDGIAESAWKNAPSFIVKKAMKADVSMPMVRVTTKAETRSIWNGAVLYLLINEKDNTPSNSAKKCSMHME